MFFIIQKNQRRMEIYTLFPDEHNEKRQLRLENAVVFLTSNNVISDIMKILHMGINEYDLFIIDKYKNLYTEIVYDKYGGSMKLA